MLEALGLIEAMEWLTIGLLIFAGVQLIVQLRVERQRKDERRADADEALDRAFQYVWAEHFRLEGLADELDRRDLIEMAYLGVLRPEEVLPRNWSRLMEAVSSLSREAGMLGGMAVGLCTDVERSVRILVTSIDKWRTECPQGMRPGEQVQWLRKQYGADLSAWEVAVRKGVRELAGLLWDAARHNPRINLDRRLEFVDDLKSDLAIAAVAGMKRRELSASGTTPLDVHAKASTG